MSEPTSTQRHFKITLGGGAEPVPRGTHGIFTSIRAFFGGSTPNHLHLRERLLFLWSATLIADLIFSVLAYLLENNRPGSDLHSYGDALFWTTTQLLTISSNRANPVTSGGEVLDVVMEFLGITLITAQAGALGSFLYRHSMERSPLRHSIEGVAEMSAVHPETGRKTSEEGSAS